MNEKRTNLHTSTRTDPNEACGVGITSRFVLLSALLWAGCAHTQHVSPEGAARTTQLAELEKAAQGKTVTVVLLDTTRHRGAALRAGADSLHWTSTPPQTPRGAPLSTVHAVTWTNHALGAVEGLTLGALGGLTFSAAVKYVRSGPAVRIASPWEAVAFGGIMTFYTLPGLLIGASGGHTTRYVINEREEL